MIERIGKYQILERIGRGGMGTVFKARDPVLERLVAIKMISSDAEITDELKARFYREARAGAMLSHPNIVVVYDLGEEDGRLYIVMELLEGEELKGLIAARRALLLETKLRMMLQICEGLHYAHQQGIIHRDIKPGNLFVLRNGQVKILDFGIARLAGADSGLTSTGVLLGTLRYMAPEQASGRVDHRSDIFSLGAVFYELLTYRPAFDSEDPMALLELIRSDTPTPLREMDPTIPVDLAATIDRALEKDPARRFPDLGAMRQSIEAVRGRLREEPTQGPEHSPYVGPAAISSPAAPAPRGGPTPPAWRSAAPVAAAQERLDPEPGGAKTPPARNGRLGGGRRASEPGGRNVTPAPERRPPAPRAVLERSDDGTSPVLPPRPRRGPTRRVAGWAVVAVASGGVLLGVGWAAWHRPVRAAMTASTSPSPAVAVPSPLSAPAAPAERDLAEESKSKAVTAREAATKADAERLAPKTWATATTMEREAATALGQQEFRRAQGDYREALRLYEQATAEAREAAAVASTRAEVGRVQEWTLQARRAAEKADAATRAPALWALAVGVQRSAEAALTRQDVGQAQALWRKAEKGYRDAERAALDAAAAASAAEQARLVTQQREFQQAEQAGAAARRARRDAEQAQVPRYASQMIAVAAAKEQEAQTALDRQDYVTAQQRFREAQQEYQRAAQEAQAAAEAERSRTAALQRQVAEEAQRLATLQETMGQARTELATSRQAALQSEADRLAPLAFASARSKEAEADGLAAQQKFAVAALAYRDATRRYDEAQRRAQLRRDARVEADQARTAMLAEKQKARRGAPDFGAAVREEQQATALYDALDFANATQHFQAARTLFAKAATPQPPPALPRFTGDRGGSGDKGGDRGGDKGGGHK